MIPDTMPVVSGRSGVLYGCLLNDPVYSRRQLLAPASAMLSCHRRFNGFVLHRKPWSTELKASLACVCVVPTARRKPIRIVHALSMSMPCILTTLPSIPWQSGRMSERESFTVDCKNPVLSTCKVTAKNAWESVVHHISLASSVPGGLGGIASVHSLYPRCNVLKQF